MKEIFERPGPLAWGVCISILVHSGLLAMHFSGGRARPAAQLAQTLEVHLAQARRPEIQAPVPAAVEPPPRREIPPEPEPVPQPVPPAAAAAESESPIAFEPLYIDAKNLSERPRFVDDLFFEAADAARVAALGELDVQFFISNSGVIDRVQVDGLAASEADKEWLAGLLQRQRLLPGRLGNAPVRSRWHIQINPADASAPAAN
ncbi:MAG: hypothetical protein FWD62_03775 [Betaproteobacteria bacterium]|nr:hypothetical protein [Betaproteobacteria bacterium]